MITRDAAEAFFDGQPLYIISSFTLFVVFPRSVFI